MTAPIQNSGRARQEKMITNVIAKNMKHPVDHIIDNIIAACHEKSKEDAFSLVYSKMH